MGSLRSESVRLMKCLFPDRGERMWVRTTYLAFSPSSTICSFSVNLRCSDRWVPQSLCQLLSALSKYSLHIQHRPRWVFKETPRPPWCRPALHICECSGPDCVLLPDCTGSDNLLLRWGQPWVFRGQPAALWPPCGRESTHPRGSLSFWG